MTYIVGLDIGGTFTDCVIVDAAGGAATGKSRTRPESLATSVIGALEEAARAIGDDGGLEISTVLEDCVGIFHGTTLTTNTMVQRKGTKTGLLTTRGHRDVMSIMRAAGRTAGVSIDRLMDVVNTDKPTPLVPKTLIREVDERVDADGDEVIALNEQQVRDGLAELVDAGVEAVAISFLWSFRHPEHEQRAKAIAEEAHPDLFVSASAELASRVGEYERTTTAVINSYVGPGFAEYLTTLESELRGRGFGGPIFVMQSNGGAYRLEEAGEAPVFTIGSGPAAGMTACSYLAGAVELDNVIATDMGGTTFDVGLIYNSRPVPRSIAIVDQYAYFSPAVDIESIGSGGGSIISFDRDSESFRVGPESAGGDPGPACYGLGGTAPTVTDANLVLGYLDAETFLGGQHRLDEEAARKALQAVGDQLDLSAEEVAWGAIRVVEYQMAELIRRFTVERGYDPREFVVFAYGGAAAIHAARYTELLGCPKVVIPQGNAASVWSAVGAAASDVQHVHDSPALLRSPFDPAELEDRFAELERVATERLADEGFTAVDIEFERFLDMRYGFQIHVVEVALAEVAGGGRLETEADVETLVDAFDARYEALFGRGSAYKGAGEEIIGFRLLATGKTSQPAIARTAAGEDDGAEPIGERPVWFEREGALPTAIYDGTELAAGQAIAGPAIVQLPFTTIVVPPECRLTADDSANFVLDTAGSLRAADATEER